MVNPAILKAALEKAEANGWVYKHELDRLHIEYLLTHASQPYLSIIFSHAFAKALWGETTLEGLGGSAKNGWEYHIQQMAIADNRLEYLGANT